MSLIESMAETSSEENPKQEVIPVDDSNRYLKSHVSSDSLVKERLEYQNYLDEKQKAREERRKGKLQRENRSSSDPIWKTISRPSKTRTLLAEELGQKSDGTDDFDRYLETWRSSDPLIKERLKYQEYLDAKQQLREERKAQPEAKPGFISKIVNFFKERVNKTTHSLDKERDSVEQSQVLTNEGKNLRKTAGYLRGLGAMLHKNQAPSSSSNTAPKPDSF